MYAYYIPKVSLCLLCSFLCPSSLLCHLLLSLSAIPTATSPSAYPLLPECHHCQNSLVQINFSPFFPSFCFSTPPPSALHRFVTPDRPLSYTPPQIPPLLHLHLIIDSCLQVNILSLPSHPSLTQPSSSV